MADRKRGVRLFVRRGNRKNAGRNTAKRLQNGAFARWLGRKENMYYNRLCVLTLCLALSSTVVALCFSFLGARVALMLSALPFWGFLLWFVYADGKYALKVRIKRTGRLVRLFLVYILLLGAAAFFYIWLLSAVADINGSSLYALLAYLPFALFTLFTPIFLIIANAITGIFENARNAKFVKRAGQVLDETKIIRVAIVGSYGKTSVKNILKTIVSQTYETVATPESYNTPVGVAKTVYSAEFSGKEVFIAEMGARKGGDIAELCALVKPDYAIFTGVCEQHIQTFGSLDRVFTEKKRVIEGTKGIVVCGEALKEKLTAAYPSNTRSSSLISGLPSRIVSRMVGMRFPPSRPRVESALGSQPICMTFRPIRAKAEDKLETVVDFPIPPFPYTAIFSISILLCKK